MISQQFGQLIVGLNDGGIRYLIVGELAVIAHGYTRLTQDIEVVLDLQHEAVVLQAINVLERLGYLPRAPVPFREFADQARRDEWTKTKDMLVFSLYHSDQGTEVDLFLSSPFDFEQAWQDRDTSDIGDGVIANFVDLRRLLDMKQVAGRAKDLEDIRVLSEIKDASSGT